MTLPALFVGHGNPMNAIEDNAYSRAWRRLGDEIPRPKAVLCVSAHWYVPGTNVTAMSHPKTIHDFGGFPRKLYEVQYPAPGDVPLADRVASLLAPLPVGRDGTWGIDHGAWSVLIHLYPNADVPVVQLSIDETQPSRFHYEIGRKLAPLRDEGILILGSGNIVHNLEAFAWGRHPAEPYPWARQFERRVRDTLTSSDGTALVDYETLGEDAMLSIPTPDHYLPFLYALGSRRDREPVTFPVEGIDGGSVSMLSVRFG